ncbi:hypothetical protein GPZ77_00080 [Streptomyces sp. QHH-9511]|nr:hypothetical protein GPZ77_00080 [Streptomyces sp. QHH-9511]
MLDFEEVARRARAFLDEEWSHEGMKVVLVEQQHARVGREIFFECQSDAYLRSGDPSDMAVGIGYVCVDAETGACRMLGAVESAILDLF